MFRHQKTQQCFRIAQPSPETRKKHCESFVITLLGEMKLKKIIIEKCKHLYFYHSSVR